MKILETRFDGYRFRSRLEARWAVFFKTLKIAYEYEKEGYNLNGTYYLPDFWLPALECFIEIKGIRPNEDEARRALLLAGATKKKVYIFFGNIPLPEEIPHSNSAWCFPDDRSAENSYWWCECPICEEFGIGKYGLVHLLPCQHISWLLQQYDTPRLRAAYQAARSARFEKGER